MIPKITYEAFFCLKNLAFIVDECGGLAGAVC
jgi:hypothetical protein